MVGMFERLVALRVAEEKLEESATVAAVIRDNLFGLEIDPRCTQIGAFNLALAAWRRVGYCTLPAMNIACSGLVPNAKMEDWLKLAGDDDRLQNGMDSLYRLFKDASVLGSLINPRAAKGNLIEAGFHELQPLLKTALAHETKDDTAHEMAVTAQGLAKAAEILAGQFSLVATNVPYLGRGKQDEVLVDYCDRVHPEAKADLATCFVERCLCSCLRGGSIALVTPQNWLFLGTYRKLRQRLLQEIQWDAVARLGEHAFDSSQAAGAFVAMLGLTNMTPTAAHEFAGFDAAEQSVPNAKESQLIKGLLRMIEQREQLSNPDGRVVIGETVRGSLLSEFADSYWGQGTGDFLRFGRNFWEVPQVTRAYDFMQSTVISTKAWGGREFVIFWQEGKGELVQLAEDLRERLKNIHRRGEEAWGRTGVSVSLMRDLYVTRYGGQIFDGNCAAVVPKNVDTLSAIWAFCSSSEFNDSIRKIDQKVNVTNHTLLKVPFDLAHWQKVAAEKYPQGLPTPFSSDPTQWLFNGHPKGSDQPLHVAVSRLLDYLWPRQTGSSFPDCPALDPNSLEALADRDGIVCLSATKGEVPAAERLRGLLVEALSKFDVRDLIANAGPKGSKSETLEDWLRDEFFEQHCAIFQNRPFIWHVWDGNKSGFSALVNYHKLSHANLEKLTYAYLGDWIRRQQAAVDAGESGSDARLLAAKQLQARLKLILEGEPPYDIFVRWKPLSKQAIGWHPDINDGVRMNIRPFATADILRKRVKIKWEKDRGKEPVRDKKDFPWFWNWDEVRQDFSGVGKEPDGNRWNDCHYTNGFKKSAREASKAAR